MMMTSVFGSGLLFDHASIESKRTISVSLRVYHGKGRIVFSLLSENFNMDFFH